MNSSFQAQRGNVMFYILIAVALLAALIFAVGQSGRGSIQQVNEEKARILASEILEYSNNVSTAFAQLRLRGCKLDEMSFENPVIAGYTNAGSPADKTCHVFELAGGGITFKRPPPEAIEDGQTGIHKFSGDNEIEGVGTTCGGDGCTDLVMYSGPLLQEVCIQINDSLGVGASGATPPQSQAEVGAAAKFDGSMGNEITIGDTGPDAAIRGRNAGCFEDLDTNRFFYYKVLVGQ